ncbi:MAG: four-carbon acid sugar kinase family protein [Paracoccaceae bacterium]
MIGPVTAIIADDLTGALDSAVPFAQFGWKTVAVTSLGAIPQALDAGAEVVSVSLGSREIPQAEAVARVTAATQALAGFPVLLKKVDSRLKGNVSAELAALLNIRRPRSVMVCPAIPELGRYVRNGCVLGMGIAEPISIAPHLPRFAQAAMVVADAETDQDLTAIVEDAAPGTVFVGARGLACALARHLASGRRAPVSEFGWSGPVAVVVGSRDPITLEQVACVRASGLATWIGAPDGFVPDQPAEGSVVVQATAGTGAVADGQAVAGRLAEGFARVHASTTRTLVLTGGETAAAVFEALDVTALDVLGEAQPGLPVCRRLDQRSGPVFVTKSGGFGEVDCLLRLMRHGEGRR